MFLLSYCNLRTTDGVWPSIFWLSAFQIQSGLYFLWYVSEYINVPFFRTDNFVSRIYLQKSTTLRQFILFITILISYLLYLFYIKCSYGDWSQWLLGLRRSLLGRWAREFESRLRHVCLSLSFCVVQSCIGYRPCIGLIPRPRSPTNCRNYL
jgi:hypothetical protein